MPRALLGCLTIVAAFQLHLAAAPALVEDVPLSPRVAALAASLGIDPSRDRARFMADMARALYAAPDTRSLNSAAVRATTPTDALVATRIVVPVPLPASVWGRAVFRHTVPVDDLIPSILTDKRATLLCRGLSGLDDATLGYLAEHPAIVTMLYERAAGVFAAFGQALHIRDGRVNTPGGEAYATLWQAIVAAPLDRPDLFVRALYGEFDGRLAYLFDTIDAARPEAARFALGAWLPESARAPRFRSLFAATSASYGEWHPADLPFARPLGDLASLLLRVRLDERGALAAPASRTFWREVFETDGGDLLSGDTIDAAWLVWATGGEDMYARIERLDQFAFGQRLLSRASDGQSGPAVSILRPFSRYRMLWLTLERVGVTSVDTYAAALQRATALTEVSASRRFSTIAEFQGALAFIARVQASGTIDRARAEALIRSLVSVPYGSGGYDGRFAQWWRSQLATVFPAGGTWESRAIDALAGRRVVVPETRLVWEGQLYRVDPAFAEAQRLVSVRSKQSGPTLDIAFAIDEVSRQLGADNVSLDDVRGAHAALQTLLAESSARLRPPPPSLQSPGVPVPRSALGWITEAVDRLARITRPADLRRAAAVGTALHPLADILFGNALLSFAYAMNLGDPAGAAFLGGNVALRHDFGFARVDPERRQRALWALPRQELIPGVPWHVSGALLGLEIGLAPMALQRNSLDRLIDVPKLSSIEREGVAVGVALLDPLRLHDADRDAIALAIARGGERVTALAKTPDGVDRIADELGLDGFRRRSLHVASAQAPGLVSSFLTMSDLLALGGVPPEVDLDAWGTQAVPLNGCTCTIAPSSRTWRILEGRPQLPVMAATMGDLSLTMAVMLRDLGVPTRLFKTVLQIGMQDLMDNLDSRGDWLGIAQSARTMRRNRVEDYVSSAAVVDGPLVPIDDDGSTREH